MDYLIKGNFVVIRFDRGEKFMECFKKLCLEHDWKSGQFSGIGAFNQVELGYYQLDSKKYETKKLEQNVEVVSLQGNLSLLNGEPLVHAHVIVSDQEFKTFAGHLFEGKVSIALELSLVLFPFEIDRKPDEFSGLNLMTF